MEMRNAEFRSDRLRTRERIEKLGAYFLASVLNGDGSFICQHEEVCKKSFSDALPCGVFYAGQLHHIGKHYDRFKENKPFRVVVGQSYGHEPASYSMDDRSELVDLVGREESARGSRDAGVKKRNPHMSGTTFALRATLGLGLDDISRATEFIQVGEDKIHIFEAFALVDFLLCSAISEEGKKGDRSTREMQSNCAAHFHKALEILEPNLVIAQGTAAWIARAGLGSGGTSPEAETIMINAATSLLLKFPHPSTRKAGEPALEIRFCSRALSQRLRRLFELSSTECRHGPGQRLGHRNALFHEADRGTRQIDIKVSA
jgi:hypothetical protein